MNIVEVPVKPKSVADYASRSTSSFLTMLKGRGYDTVLRYVNGTQTHWKVLTVAERELIWSMGMSIMLVWETHAGRPLLGASAGRIDGKLAAQDAKRLGYPVSCVMWVAFDIDVKDSNRSVCVAYWHAFRAAYKAEMGPDAKVGQYGDWDMTEAIGDVSDGNWQPNAAFWSSVWDMIRLRWRYRGTHPKAHLQQFKTVDNYDPNDVRLPGLFAWVKNTPTYPDPTPMEDTVKTLPKPWRWLDTRETRTPMFARQPIALEPKIMQECEVNLTIVNPTADGYLVVWGDGEMPKTSNVAFNAGYNASNTARVWLGSKGQLHAAIFPGNGAGSTVQAHLVVDVQGAG